MVIHGLLTWKFFGRHGVKLKYKNTDIGKFSIATALRSPINYKNKLKYYIVYLKSLYVCVVRVQHFINMKNSIKCVYINDPFYTNGIYSDLSIIHKIPLYHNTIPYTLTC